jgi:hypothetical protein
LASLSWPACRRGRPHGSSRDLGSLRAAFYVYSPSSPPRAQSCCRWPACPWRSGCHRPGRTRPRQRGGGGQVTHGVSSGSMHSHSRHSPAAGLASMTKAATPGE